MSRAPRRRPLPAGVIAAAALAAALAAGCDRTPPAGRPSREAPERMTPGERGEARARADAAAGRMRVFAYGIPLAPGNPRTDEASGLPVRVLLECCVTDAGREETEGYNRVMRELARSRATAPSP